MTDGDYPSLLILGGLLLVSAFFSGSETAIIGSSRVALTTLAEKGHGAARIALKMLDNPSSLLGTILVGNNLVNVAAAAIGAAILGPFWATIIITLLLLLIGEVPPKTVAAQWPERVTLIVSYPIWIIKIILTPLVWMVSTLTDLMLLPFLRRMGPAKEFYSRDEIRTALDQSHLGGELEPGEAQMVQEILDLPKMKIHEIMIPAHEAATIETDWSMDQLLEQIRRSRFSRYPVYRPHSHRLDGMLHIKDLLLGEPDRRWQSYIRTMPRRSRDMDADDLLRDMQIARYHMAAVTGDNERVVGYVTMERILEEIVGEIADEHDREIDPVRTLAAGIYLIRRDLEVADVSRILNVDIPCDDPDNTIFELYRKLGGGRPASAVRLEQILLRPGKQGMVIQLFEEPELDESPPNQTAGNESSPSSDEGSVNGGGSNGRREKLIPKHGERFAFFSHERYL